MQVSTWLNEKSSYISVLNVHENDDRSDPQQEMSTMLVM